eukprot:scaffold69536_cov24-Tisochrysis_lutea.AAC.1
MADGWLPRPALLLLLLACACMPSVCGYRLAPAFHPRSRQPLARRCPQPLAAYVKKMEGLESEIEQ